MDKDYLKKLEEQCKENAVSNRALQNEISVLKREFDLIQKTVIQKDTRWYPLYHPGDYDTRPECRSRELLSAAGFVYSGYSESTNYGYTRELWIKREEAK